MIAKLEWIQSSAQQNIEQLQNPTMGETINNESTTTEPTALERTAAKATGKHENSEQSIIMALIDLLGRAV